MSGFLHLGGANRLTNRTECPIIESWKHGEEPPTARASDPRAGAQRLRRSKTPIAAEGDRLGAWPRHSRKGKTGKLKGRETQNERSALMAYLNRRRRDQATPEGHDSGRTKERKMKAENDNEFVPLQRGELLDIGKRARAAFTPDPGSVLAEDVEEWFAVRDAVAARVARNRSGYLDVECFDIAKMIADHLVTVRD